MKANKPKISRSAKRYLRKMQDVLNERILYAQGFISLNAPTLSNNAQSFVKGSVDTCRVQLERLNMSKEGERTILKLTEAEAWERCVIDSIEISEEVKTI